MAIEPQYCANENCIKHTQHRGGRFRFKASTKQTFCEDCFPVESVMNDCKNLYEFTTVHLNNERIHVTGKAHLRQLEKKFGVSHHQLNNMERNWGT